MAVLVIWQRGGSWAGGINMRRERGRGRGRLRIGTRSTMQCEGLVRMMLIPIRGEAGRNGGGGG